MSKIIIRTVANQALTKSLRESLNSESSHRTYTGAARRLLKIDRDSDEWSRCVGHWGRVEIEIDGEALDNTEVYYTLDTMGRKGNRSVEEIARILAL